MGIQINGTNDTISATDGGLNIEGSDIRLPSGSSIGVNGAAAQTPIDVISNSSGNGITVRGRSADGLGNIRFTSNNYGTLYGGLTHNATNLNLFNERAGSLILGSNGIDRVTIDSSGRVTKPYTPHIFGSIGNNSTQNSSFASYMNVFSSTELTFSNSRITVPVAGVYMITFTTISDNVTARKDANIFINGTSRLAMLTDDSSTGYKYRSGSMSVKLSANDYIQFFNATWYDYTNTSYIDWRTASVTLLG